MGRPEMTALRSEKDLSAEFKEKSYEGLRKSWQFMLLFFIIEAQMDSANSAVVVFDRRSRMLSIIREGAAFFGRRKYPVFLLTLAVFSGMVLQSAASARAGDLTGNGTANVVAGDSYNYVYGRRSRTGSAVASGSIVRVTGGTITQSLYGGRAESSSGSAEADSNSVLVSGGMAGFAGSVYGGRADTSTGDAEADGNHVVFDGSFNLGSDVQVFGGYAYITGGSGRAEAVDNLVDIRGNSDLDFLVGGEARGSSGVSALATGNTVRFSGGTVGTLYGGYATTRGNASALDNLVSFRSGTFRHIVGGEVTSVSGDAVARGNVVTITGGTGTGSVFGASVQADVGKAVAEGNTVSISQASISGEVIGGFARFSPAPGSVTGNSVVVGAGAQVSGNAVGGATDDNMSGGITAFNTVAVVDSGQVDGDVIGGLSYGQDTSTSYNTVLVRGGTVNGDIVGGVAGTGVTPRHNTVIIGEGASLAEGTSLFGGSVGAIAPIPDTSDTPGTPGTLGNPVAAAGSGNTLFVDSWQGTVERVAGFENLHFVLPTPGAPVDVPMLTVTAAQPGDFSGTTVTAQLPDIITGGRVYLGDTFTLVRDDNGAIKDATAGRLVSLLQGYATYFDGVLENTGKAVQLQLTEVRMNPRIAALTEARAAAAGLLNQGGDLIEDTGMRHAREAAEHNEDEQWSPFAAVYGGVSRYHTGSRADTEGFSGMTGLTGSFRTGVGRTLVGGFVEFGRAHLDTFNGFDTGNVNGQGTSQYVGAGVLARYEVASGPLSGLYLEGVGRIGNIDTKWHSGDLRDNMDRPADYDLSTPYYGAHVGLGHVLSLGDVVNVDTYGKFLWTHQSSDSADMNGEIVNFEGVDSRRLRLGVRLDVTAFENVTPYLGAAWEHEYSGTARAVARDFSIPDASLKGDSGVFELGFAMETSARPLTLDVALIGSTGARDSLGGNLSVLYRF